MEYRKTKDEIEAMTVLEIANYLSEITQTPICKDKKYCNLLVSIFIKK